LRTIARCLRESASTWYLWLGPGLLVTLTIPLVIYLPLVQKQLIDQVMLARRLDLLLPTMALFAGIWLVIPILQTAGSLTRTYLDERLLIVWRNRIFAHCEALAVPLWHREHSGRTMALFTNDVPVVTGFLGSGLVIWLANLLTLVAGAITMLSLSWELAVVVLVVPPLIGGVAAVTARPLRRMSRRVQDKAAEMAERLLEGLSGLREIVAFGQERSQGARYQLIQQELLALRMRLVTLGALIGAGQSVFSLTVTGTLLGVGGYLVIQGQTTIGTVLAMQQLYGQIFPTALQFAGTVLGAQQVLASMDRVYDLLDQKPRVGQRLDARPPTDVRGAIRFRDVSFGYTSDRVVIRNVSFEAKPGEMVALVGPSGAGKSTLVGLVARFYDPDQGQVLLDGVDLRALTLDGLRSQIGIVFQDPFLFASTIRENIAFGREGATEDEIVAAARAAHAWEFIEKLPARLDAEVGQRAVQVSAGQKQRLAIARALLRSPRILILDEPTSALDARSEHLLQQALDNLSQGRTTFVIAHRLATVLRADRILVLDNGSIVEQGTHFELMAVHGLYRELYELQFADPRVAEATPKGALEAQLITSLGRG
jgi:subfamily B ATP-binding cassette protein MsbA